MSRVATRRLLDASATLDAADRALLNIWLNRGMNDVALARMTGLDEATVVARRVRIVTHLSATLSLPPDTIRGALDEIAASAEARPIAEGTPPSANGTPPPTTPTPSADLAGPPSPGGTPRADAAASAAEPAAEPAADSAAGDSTSRRRWLWGLPLTAIVVAVALIVSLGSGGSGRNHSSRRAPATTRPAAPAGTAAPVPPRTATAARPAGDPLVVLAGGPAHATGTAQVAGKRSHLRLHLSVSNLPPAKHGHYEIWLYDSIIYARDLGRLRAGVSHVSLQLPPNAPRFRWIDISFQPPGLVFHSGGSLLRSPNPLFKKAGVPGPR